MKSTNDGARYSSAVQDAWVSVQMQHLVSLTFLLVPALPKPGIRLEYPAKGWWGVSTRESSSLLDLPSTYPKWGFLVYVYIR